jgi:hypothetical protein
MSHSIDWGGLGRGKSRPEFAGPAPMRRLKTSHAQSPQRCDARHSRHERCVLRSLDMGIG